MTASFQFTPQATADIDTIWWFIAKDNQVAADLVEAEIVASCRRLAKHPRMGTKRQDITPLNVRFWTVTKFPNYVIVYRPETVSPAGSRPAKRKTGFEGDPPTAVYLDSPAAVPLP